MIYHLVKVELEGKNAVALLTYEQLMKRDEISAELTRHFKDIKLGDISIFSEAVHTKPFAGLIYTD